MKIKIINPKPYLHVVMDVSFRKFHETKNKLWNLSKTINEEVINGYVEEKCDYEGDLCEIKIYNCEETKEYIQLIKKEFNIEQDIQKGMDILFSAL